MIFTQENEAAVLDACVLVPMALCDTLLRLAEEPATYRPIWSEQILEEMARALELKLHRTAAEAAYRRQQMNAAFPEAMVTVPSALIKALDCIPDKNDRHVLAAAIMAHASVIVTQNKKHFPQECLDPYGVVCQNVDEFLINQYQRNKQLILDKLDDQAAAISKDRTFVITSLRPVAPKLVDLLQGSSS